MCNANCIIFGVNNISKDEVRDKRIIEVGSLDVNGSLRSVYEKWAPKEYIGVDLENGPGVDCVCGVEELAEKYGKNSFDLVISNELLEHVKDWRSAIKNLKKICRPGGIILLTTRSPGFYYHAYPHDYWRFAPEDMKNIFSDFDILALERDPEAPGVFLKAKKPANFKINNLDNHKLFSVVTESKTRKIEPGDFCTFNYCKLFAKEKIKIALKAIFK